MQELYIETSDQLSELCDLIRHSQWLALDTEFMREKSYYPQLCLLQLCNGDVAACVDPLGLPDLQPLIKILSDQSIVKVFHAGRQDLEIFQHLWQRLPTPLFDTQLAATLLDLGEQVGYAALVQQLLGIELAKGHTRTDWTRRPLQQGQLRYALDDVIYLGEIYLELTTRLLKLGRESWLQEEFALLADPATYMVAPSDAWQRIRGRQKLRGKQLAVLRALASWRESEAIKADRPRRWIMKDDILLELARRQPREMEGLARLRGMEQGTIRRHGQTLLELIGESCRQPKEQWPEEGRPPVRLSPDQEAMVDLLSCSLRLLAKEHRITPAAIASQKSLALLVSGERDLDLLRGWRRMMAGNTLLDVLNGKVAPRLQGGELRLAPC